MYVNVKQKKKGRRLKKVLDMMWYEIIVCVSEKVAEDRFEWKLKLRCLAPNSWELGEKAKKKKETL